MWTLQDAKNGFSAVVDAALAGVPQRVTRRGVPAVVVVAASEYERLAALSGEPCGSFVGHLLAFPGAEPELSSGRARVEPRAVEF